VLTSMVTSPVDAIEIRDNGNIIMLRFMAWNTFRRIENPYIPMAHEGFKQAADFLGGDSELIIMHRKKLEKEYEERELAARSTTMNLEGKKRKKKKDGGTTASSMNMSETEMTEDDEEEEEEDFTMSKAWQEEQEDESEEMTETDQLSFQVCFNTYFQLSVIELVLRCCSFGFNKTVLKQFSRSIFESQTGKEDVGDGEEKTEKKRTDEDDEEGTQARQKYFRHLIFWLTPTDSGSDTIPVIPMVAQDAFIRMMCVMLRPHEIEEILHNRFDAYDCFEADGYGSALAELVYRVLQALPRAPHSEPSNLECSGGH